MPQETLKSTQIVCALMSKHQPIQRFGKKSSLLHHHQMVLRHQAVANARISVCKQAHNMLQQIRESVFNFLSVPCESTMCVGNGLNGVALMQQFNEALTMDEEKCTGHSSWHVKS